MYLPCIINFNPRSLAGATDEHIRWSPVTGISIHAPSRERHEVGINDNRSEFISIHAPSRERLARMQTSFMHTAFQSTLPRGSDARGGTRYTEIINFNPRSLAGATDFQTPSDGAFTISIHAPSRERRRGSNFKYVAVAISIHAPSRERPICS